jgi:uncharacterized membrane protein HdeD (DUF308 family)
MSHGLGYSGVAGKWGWFVALGLVLIVAGVFAFGAAVAITLISVVFIGAMLLVGGIFQLIHAFATKTWTTFLLNAICGAVYIAGGLAIMDEPVNGSVIITLLLVASLIIGAALRIAVALRHREMAGWWVMLLGGVVSLAVGALLLATLPWSGLWVLGTLVAVELLVQGVTWLQFGLALRLHHRLA